ncbi:PREDICTED: carcinoembryonic antigen-related cell adhesion molecule 3-like [Elephantulus edwardii]|uniref:carcinoembryonic antigen-related cell adhesion molecule 3-like n=1 Tax=Elephantulus edwardii TaxID=28737 RepID=UPI0003F0743E|nr:PREDICTED: carcinoembryonic antigen-related cell adhesion molecule 3-like [Elephantulus edwardii]
MPDVIGPPPSTCPDLPAIPHLSHCTQEEERKPSLTTQLTVESMPFSAAKGEEVLLIHHLPQNSYDYSWYRGQSIQHNGALLLQNVSQKDEGTYTLQVLKNDVSQSKQAPGQFHVYRKPPRPSITEANADGTLLTVSLLFFWSSSISAKLSMNSTLIKAIEGDDVLLLVYNLPPDTLECTWYKGDKLESDFTIAAYTIPTEADTLGPAHSGREVIYSNGSLLLQDVIPEDTEWLPTPLI